MKKKTIEDFILESNKIHNSKYDYTNSVYIDNNTKLKIICSEHGEFEQKPNKHICNKQGCPKCGSSKTSDKQKNTIEFFIQKANEVHSDKYDYSKVIYKNTKTKVIIICPIHGEFEQTPDNHLSGRGCMYCGGTIKMDGKLFISKAQKIHNNKYDYSKVVYTNSRTKVTIICPIHGEFEQTPNNHLSKEQGCFECLGKIYNTDTFKTICSIVHNNKYDYSKVIYNNSQGEVEIICPIHGEFNQRVDSHRQGNGCIKCSNNGTSSHEIEIKTFIKSLDVKIIENTRKIIKSFELDIYLPDHKIAIEYNGLYWHSEIYKDKNYHLNKTQLCSEQDIQLIHIFEDEWLNKQDIVKSRLKNILGLTQKRVYGRKCEIKEVSTKQAREFLINNHLQGYSNSSIRLGLYYENKLVSLMTFGNLRKILGQNKKENSYELLRFVNELDTSVIGGADKLFKYFIKNYNPKEVISYADKRWSVGNLYEKLGFEFVHDSKPSYFYIINKERKYRFNYRKDLLVKDGYDKAKSEHDIMLERGIYRIYDSGNKKYILRFFTISLICLQQLYLTL